MLAKLGVSGLALIAGFSIAAAQQPAKDQDQQAPNNAQGSMKSQQGGKEEPGSHPAGTAITTEVFVDGKLAVPGAPADGQTVPSKASERNARLDATPLMALPWGLNDEEKKKILDNVKSVPVTQISAKPADMLPQTTAVSELPADVKQAVPLVSDLAVIRTPDKILLVRAPNMVVISEIPVQ